MSPGGEAPGTSRGAGSASAGGPGGSGFLGAVLAGGESRRFGRDKAAEPVGGVPMMERAVAALEPACREVIVVSSRPATPRGRWRVVPDLRPGQGPLAGIESALAEAAALGAEAVVVLAADLPLVDAHTVARLLQALAPEDGAVAAARAPVQDGLAFEPLCAVYRVGCRDVVAGLLDRGRRDARALFQGVEGRVVDVAGGAALNVNTQEALAEAEAVLGESEEALAEAGSAARQAGSGPSEAPTAEGTPTAEAATTGEGAPTAEAPRDDRG